MRLQGLVLKYFIYKHTQVQIKKLSNLKVK